MKLNLIVIILLTCGSISSCSNQANNSPNSETKDTTIEQSRSYKEDTSIQEIMVNTAMFLRNYNAAENNDRSFAQLMIYYNHAAINLSNILLGNGKNAILIKFAKNSMTRRREVIKEMKLFLQEEPENESYSAKEFQKSVNTAVSEMRSSLSFQKSDIDILYIQSMMVFNQTGINIAEAELKYGSHQTLKIHARNILSAEREQLQQFQSWLNKSD